MAILTVLAIMAQLFLAANMVVIGVNWKNKKNVDHMWNWIEKNALDKNS